jgi:hypothetical protein
MQNMGRGSPGVPPGAEAIRGLRDHPPVDEKGLQGIQGGKVWQYVVRGVAEYIQKGYPVLILTQDGLAQCFRRLASHMELW